MNFIKIPCSCCGKEFDKLLYEYNRRLKKNENHKFVCTDEDCDIRVDSLTPFRQLLKKRRHGYNINVIRRKTDYPFEIDAPFLKNLYDKQEGLCSISKLKLTLPRHQLTQGGLFAASIDRINNNKGYVEGNVQILNSFMNMAKNTFNDNEIRDFCQWWKEGAAPKPIDNGSTLQQSVSLLMTNARNAILGKVKKCKGRSLTITQDQLAKLWERQNGVCNITGIEMQLPGNKRNRIPKCPRLVSVDRIDNDKGYTIDNIHLVCLAINYGRKNANVADFLEYVESFTALRVPQPQLSPLSISQIK